MKLRKLRISGFKTFVDATTIEFPGDLVGIVGPNGCGKSNIIDSIRWVMGELSTKHLRASSMADIIFSGSAKRPTASQASVELIFDNSEGKAGGKFTSYSEISLKRVVFADSQAHYFLNGVKCRRRDITDLLLGTGLGPRSYAVVEQGMISSIVEAKPDELRQFLEEVAGISAYRERRRETESRMRRTQENMERLQDLRDEIGKRLVQLKRQASQAESYRKHKSGLRLLEVQLRALRWRALHGKEQRRISERQQLETKLEASIAQLRQTEKELEQQREKQIEITKTFNESYQKVLQAGADIARHEEAIDGFGQRRVQLERDLEIGRVEREKATKDIAELDEKLRGAATDLTALEPTFNRLLSSQQQVEAEFQKLEREYEESMQRGETIRSHMVSPEGIAQAESARTEALKAHIEQLKTREGIILEDVAATKSDYCHEQNELAGKLLAEAEQEVLLARSEMNDNEVLLKQLSAQLETLEQRKNEYEQQKSELTGRFESLRDVQDTALGKTQEGFNNWLKKRSLENHQRLGECIQVDAKWSRAVEVALDRVLRAICVDDFDELDDMDLLERTGGALIIGRQVTDPSASSGGASKSLVSKVHTSPAIAAILADYLCIDDYQSGLQRRAELSANQKWITPDGFIVASNWLAAAPVDGAKSGIVERKSLLERLKSQLSKLDDDLANIDEQLSAQRIELKDCKGTNKRLKNTVREKENNYNDQRIRTDRVQESFRVAERRLRQLSHEKDILAAQLDSDNEAILQSEQRLAEARRSLADIGKRAENNKEQQARLKAMVDAARLEMDKHSSENREVVVRTETLKTRISALEEAKTAGDGVLASINQRLERVRTTLEQIDEPLRQQQSALEALVQSRREFQREVEKYRDLDENAQHQSKRYEQKKLADEKEVENIRASANESRLLEREISVQRKSVEDELDRLGKHDLQQLLSELAEDATTEEWEKKIESLETKIRRLGAINLAAIEEHEQHAERKGYLDAQHADLDEAMATLREAINRMDKETRQRFKETFKKVSAELDKLFKTLFSGGEASLLMTENDLLTTGVTIMARPPGKRNQSIHSLSGGEKALTALSLMFALFSLNPAPFCILDEVDAPLDDSNVIRFARLLEEFESAVQFIVVSHNKLTLEKMQQLIGVTMNEPGVSRLVSVDIDKAVEMAAVEVAV